MNEGRLSGRKLTIIPAPAGFGKTMLVSEWIANCGQAVAWLSLDEGDNDPARFLNYLVAALQPMAKGKVEGVTTKFGKGVSGLLQSSQPPPVESILTALINEIILLRDKFILVLDDYHLIDSKPVDESLMIPIGNLSLEMPV